MKRQKFRSWRDVVVCWPGKQGPPQLALRLAATDRIVGGLVICSTTVIAQKGRHRSVLWLTSGGLAVCKLAAKIMWNFKISDTSNPVHRQSDGHSVVEYAVENPTESEQVVVSKIPEVPSMEWIHEQIVECIKEVPQERVQQRTVEQNVCMSVPTVQEQMDVQEIPGTQVVERIQKQIAETIPQERVQRTVEQNVCMSVPTVQEQTTVQEIPGTQVVERIQKQIAETIPQERVQRTVEQNVRTSVLTPAQMPKSLDRWLRKFELQNEEDEYIDQRGPEQMGAFEPQHGDDGRRERKSSKKKKKIVNRTVQVMERIPEHTVELSFCESKEIKTS